MQPGLIERICGFNCDATPLSAVSNPRKHGHHGNEYENASLGGKPIANRPAAHDHLQIVRKKYNHYLDIEGVVFTMYSGRFNLTMQVVAQVKKYYGNKVYKTVVPRTVRLSEAPSFGMPINFYEPNGKGSEAYMAMAREFLENNERE